MSSSNNRFGRRTGRQNDDLRAEPVLSFNPRRPGARAAQNEPAPPVDRKPQAGPRAEREDGKEFGSRFRGDAQHDPIPSFMRGARSGPRIDREDAEEFGMPSDSAGSRIGRDDDFDPRVRREKAFDDRDSAAERPLYHHLFEEQESRGRGFGWIAALGSVAVVAVGAAYAWHNFMARPAPANLFEPPGFASHGNTGYMTPPQPTTDATKGADAGSTPSPLAATPPASGDQPPTKDIAAAPEPKSVPAEAPPPPKKTISEAAANPGSLGPAANPAPAPTPPPAKKETVAAPAQVVTPALVAQPPKREAAKSDTPKRETPRKEASITPPKPAPEPAPSPQDVAAPAGTQPAAAPAVTAPPPKHESAKAESPKRTTPRKEASITPPKPSRAPAPSPEDIAPPPVTQPAAAPAVAAPPLPRAPEATGQPQPLNRNAPAAYPPPPQQQQQQQPSFATRSPPSGNFAPNSVAPSNAGPPPNAPDTVTIDGVTYVNGQEPRSLGTLNGPPPAPSNYGAMPQGAPAMSPPSAPPGYTARPYTPADHDGGAPLPNDVIILPNGQMAVPTGQR